MIRVKVKLVVNLKLIKFCLNCFLEFGLIFDIGGEIG